MQTAQIASLPYSPLLSPRYCDDRRVRTQCKWPGTFKQCTAPCAGQASKNRVLLFGASSLVGSAGKERQRKPHREAKKIHYINSWVTLSQAGALLQKQQTKTSTIVALPGSFPPFPATISWMLLLSVPVQAPFHCACPATGRSCAAPYHSFHLPSKALLHFFSPLLWSCDH